MHLHQKWDDRNIYMRDSLWKVVGLFLISSKGKQTDGVLSMSTGQRQWPRRKITEGRKEKKSFSTNAEAKLIANNAPFTVNTHLK